MNDYNPFNEHRCVVCRYSMQKEMEPVISMVNATRNITKSVCTPCYEKTAHKWKENGWNKITPKW